MTNRDIEILLEAVEFDLIRYNDRNDKERFKSLLELHVNKYKYFIKKGYFKSQKELSEHLVKYRNSFEGYLKI